MNKKTIEWRGIFAWCAAVSFYFYQFLLQVIPSVLKPQIQGTFLLNSEQFGLMAAYFLYAYGLMQIPAGIFLDRYGPKKTIPIAVLVCALGAECFALADHVSLAIFGRILTGVGSAFAVIGCFKVAALAFDRKHFSLMTGLTVMCGMSGAAFGQALVGPFIQSLSRWQDCFHLFFIIGSVLSILIYFVLPCDQISLDQKTKSWTTVLKELFTVCSSPLTIVAALYAGLMYVPTLAIGEAWGIAFLVEGHGLPAYLAHKVVPLLFLGWSCGSVLFGIASESIPRSILMPFSAIVVSFISLVFINPDISHWTVIYWGGVFFVLGACSAGFILAFTSAKEAHPVALAATTSGVMNTANTLCGAVMQQVIGYRLDRILDAQQRVIPILQDYHQALDIVITAARLSIFLSLLLAFLEYRQHRSCV